MATNFNTLYFLKGFNNYFNRIIKKYDTISEYTDAVGQDNYFTRENRNFNPNDGVLTEHIENCINVALTEEPLDQCDYLLLVSGASNPEIVSRWFITESVRTRNNQYKFTLKRDVIADKYDEVINAPCYIEKATVPNIDDVAIYNQEDIGFNEIKQEEILLDDDSTVPWLVGYYAKVSEEQQIAISSVSTPITATFETKQAFYNDLGYNNGLKYIKSYDNIYFDIDVGLNPQILGVNGAAHLTSVGSQYVFDGTLTKSHFVLQGVPTGKKRNTFVSTLEANVMSEAQTLKDTLITGQYTLKKPKYKVDNIIYITSENKFYRVIGTCYANQKSTTSTITSNAFISAFEVFLTEKGYDYRTLQEDQDGKIEITYDDYTFDLEEISNFTSFTSKIPNTANDLQDAPYNMFAIPCGRVGISMTPHTVAFNTLTKDDAVAIVQWMQANLDDTKIYDVQLLPYFPKFKDIKITKYSSTSVMDISQLTADVDYELIKSGNTNVGIIFFPNVSSFTLDITRALELPETVEDQKIALQCDKYRLCSPNMSAIFEFNLVKTGAISKFNVDCTYKPFSPYIHVNPVWGRLYGHDFDDYNGLICKGDFAITSVSEAWTEYQRNNKNYLNAFNKQIETIEAGNKIAQKSDKFQAATGIFSGVASGATSGAIMTGGNPIGAVAGGVIGGVASGIGGAMDIKYGQEMRDRELSNTISQFNYSLDNIKAIPQSLGTITTFDYNNRYFPFIERYTCTAQEKEVLKAKFKYDGMTIMRIGTINEFKQGERSFIKGRLIRLEDINEDSHYINELYSEIMKGVYI